MVLGLKEIQIRGEIRTNVDYTIDLLHVNFFTCWQSTPILSRPFSLKKLLLQKHELTLYKCVIQASDYKENKIHTGWLDSRIAMRVRAERPPWYLSVVGGALYVSICYICAYVCAYVFVFSMIYFLLLHLFQKASASSAAVVSDYVGYLEKGQIPPKVLIISYLCLLPS